MDVKELNNELGNIDIYLLDQILKGRISKRFKILDAGCGEGRNLMYFLKNGYHVEGIDQNPSAIEMVRFLCRSKFSYYSNERFQEGYLENLPYSDLTFDYVICSACLHFAQGHKHFWKMFEELNRVTAEQGTLFIRMTSDIGLTGHHDHKDGVFQIPDGSMRYLLTKSIISGIINQHSYSLIEPIKTTLVDDQRCMTTLVIQKK